MAPTTPNPLATAPPLNKSSSSSSGRGSGDTKKLGFEELPVGIPAKDIDGPKGGLWDDWKQRSGEPWYKYSLRLCREGHSVPDAFLTVAASQIGQIMLTCPNALWKAGLVSGGIFMGFSAVMSLFTMYLMNVLYVEYKRAKINAGQWGKDRPITQYHAVLGHHTGKVIMYIAQTIIVLQLLGTGVAQIIACAADWYSIEKSISKRELQLIWGGILQAFVLFPTFKHFRILNILALVGTTFTTIFLLYEAAAQGYGNISLARLWPVGNPSGAALPTAPQYFFTGSAVLLNALGGHAIAMEMMDAMETPKQYTAAYTGGWLWTLFLVIPHSIAINLAFPTQIGGADNVYGIIPMSKAKVASVSLMILHQLAAFAYYVTPVLFMWERLIGTDKKPWYIRLPSRLPVSLLVWLAAMAFPFYGAINSLMSAVSVPFTAFALPCVVFIYLYRSQASRDSAPLPPFEWLQKHNWKPIFWICGITAVFFIGYGAAAISYSLKSIVDNSKTYGIFARCYQCPPNYESLLRNPDNGL